jgi:hypothetical protein
MLRVYVVRLQKSRMGNEKSPSRDLAFNSVHAELQRRRDLAASLCPNEQMNRLTETEARRCGLPLCCMACTPTTNLSYRIEPNSLSKLCSLDQLDHSAALASLEICIRHILDWWMRLGPYGSSATTSGLRLERSVSLDGWSDRLHSPITASRMAGETPCHRARTIEPQNSITLRPTPTPRPPRLTAREII